MKKNHKIIEIVGVEQKQTPDGKAYSLTHAVIDNGTEAVGFGTKYEVGDVVEYYEHFNKSGILDRVNMVKPGARNE